MIIRVQLTLLCMVAAVASHRHAEWRCDDDVAAPDEVSDALKAKYFVANLYRIECNIPSVCLLLTQIAYRVGMRRPGTEKEEYHHVGKRAADQPLRMFVHYDSSVNTE